MSSATSCGSVLAIAVMRTVVGLYRRDKKQTPSLHTAQPMLSARGYASSCTDPPMPEHGVNLPRYLQIINLQIYVHANQSEGPWTTPRCLLPRGTAWKTEQSPPEGSYCRDGPVLRIASPALRCRLMIAHRVRRSFLAYLLHLLRSAPERGREQEDPQ